MPALPTLAEAKDVLNKTTAVADAELQLVLDDAVDIIATRVGPLRNETITGEVHGGGTDLILRRYPVVSLTSVTYWDGTVVNVADLELDKATGIVSWKYNTAGRFTAGSRNVRVTYVAGRASIPGDLRRAVLRLTKHLWDQQRGTSPTARREELEIPPASYLLPHEVQSLIEPHLLAPALA